MNEGTIEQIDRLFAECLYAEDGIGRVDEHGRYRVDDRELKEEIQGKVAELWKIVKTENFKEISDFEGYKRGFEQLFGFGVEGIDYDKAVETEVEIGNLHNVVAEEQQIK